MPGKKKAEAKEAPAVSLDDTLAALDALRPNIEELLTKADVPDKIKAGLANVSSGIVHLQNQRWELAALERA